MLYNISRFVAYCFFRFPFVKEIRGMENIPKEGCIIASNHVSYLDPSILGFTVSQKLNKKVHYLAKIELFRSFFSRAVHKLFEAIPVDRTSKSTLWIKEAKKYLRKGEVIGFFPEGERSSSGKLQKGKTGVVRLALAAKAPIVPIGITGTYDLWPINKKFPRIKKIARINIGKPVYYGSYYKKRITKSLLRRLTDNLMLEIGKLTVK
ncbi:MAG: lysophospholipid acyltransferase family protein [Nanoarchaeota archaeon]